MASGNWDTSLGGSGDVTGPGSSTDNAIARYDGTGGKTLQGSGVLIDDSDNITGATSLTVDGSSGNTLVVNSTDLVVDSTNNRVGIGTSSPSFGLHVKDNGAFASIAAETQTAANEPYFTIKTPDAQWSLINKSSISDQFVIRESSASTDRFSIAVGGDIYLGDITATSSRLLNLSNSASTTSVNLQITNGSSGQTGSDGLLVGIDNASTPNAELVNFEASDLIFKTNNITSMALDSAQNFALYGGNSTNGGSLDLTNVTTGTGSSATIDALRFLDASGAVITGPLSGFVYISMVDGADVKTIQYRYLNTGDGITNQVANLADQAQTGTSPWASTAVVADGSGVKIQVTTSASRTSVTTICRFVGVRGINA